MTALAFDSPDVVIVGAGHSGSKVAAALRKRGWQGAVTLVGDELIVPYDRPPLSKAVLLGKKTGEQCAFFPAEWYAQNGVNLLLGRSVLSIDRQDRQVILADGSHIRYDKLVLATGSHHNALNIPGADLQNVMPLRTPHHAGHLARRLQVGRNLVIIGAGVIGLEVAAAATERGCHVIVLEQAPQAMGRSIPSVMSERLVAEHVSRGVRFRFGVTVTELVGEGPVSGVKLLDGEIIDAEMVIYGVGARPRVELAEAAQLATENGVVTNDRLRSEDDAIYACGDVCKFYSNLFGTSLRLENWRNAEDQADVVARNLVGEDAIYDEVPWFWTNQYDMALQVAGISSLANKHVITHSGAAHVTLSVQADGRLVSASAIGPVRDVAAAIRKLKTAIAERVIIDIDDRCEALDQITALC